MVVPSDACKHQGVYNLGIQLATIPISYYFGKHTGSVHGTKDTTGSKTVLFASGHREKMLTGGVVTTVNYLRNLISYN